MQNTQVKPGYKKTELGVIPEDWQVNFLDAFWSVIDCKHITAEFVNTGFPIASIKEVQSRYIDLSNSKETTEKYYLSLIEGGRKPQAGDLIISRNATVGEVAQVADWHPDFAMGQDVCLLRKKKPKFSTDFLQSILRSPIILNQLLDSMVGSTFKRINIAQIRSFVILMPSEKEQKAIATALSDVDALITAQEALIAKKRDIKTATMQQLLTGKIRLGAFGKHARINEEHTEDIVFGDLFEKGCKKSTLNQSEFTFIGMEDVSERGGINRFNLLPVKNMKSGLTYFEKHDIIVAKITPCFENGKGASLHELPTSFGLGSTEFHVLRAKNNICGKYIYYHTQSPEFRRKLELEMTGTAGQKRVPFSAIQNFPLDIKHPYEEQKAIAAVLSDIDAEITALEAQRDKTKAIKQGMMQELLTGKVRLI